VAGVFEALAAVVRNQPQLRAQRQDAGKVVDLGLADVGIQAALALATGVHIPQAHAARQQPGAAVSVAGWHLGFTNFIAVCAFRQSARALKRMQFTEHPGHDGPEVVARVAVILLRRQRSRPRKTAQHQHTGVRSDQRWQALQAR